MNRRDMIKFEQFVAETYRREASARSKNPELAAQLVAWSEASERRVEHMRTGPLFGGAE